MNRVIDFATPAGRVTINLAYLVQAVRRHDGYAYGDSYLLQLGGAPYAPDELRFLASEVGPALEAVGAPLVRLSDRLLNLDHVVRAMPVPYGGPGEVRIRVALGSDDGLLLKPEDAGKVRRGLELLGGGPPAKVMRYGVETRGVYDLSAEEWDDLVSGKTDGVVQHFGDGQLCVVDGLLRWRPAPDGAAHSRDAAYRVAVDAQQDLPADKIDWWANSAAGAAPAVEPVPNSWGDSRGDAGLTATLDEARRLGDLAAADPDAAQAYSFRLRALGLLLRGVDPAAAEWFRAVRVGPWTPAEFSARLAGMESQARCGELKDAIEADYAAHVKPAPGDGPALPEFLPLEAQIAFLVAKASPLPAGRFTRLQLLRGAREVGYKGGFDELCRRVEALECVEKVDGDYRHRAFDPKPPAGLQESSAWAWAASAHAQWDARTRESDEAAFAVITSELDKLAEAPEVVAAIQAITCAALAEGRELHDVRAAVLGCATPPDVEKAPTGPAARRKPRRVIPDPKNEAVFRRMLSLSTVVERDDAAVKLAAMPGVERWYPQMVALHDEIGVCPGMTYAHEGGVDVVYLDDDDLRAFGIDAEKLIREAWRPAEAPAEMVEFRADATYGFAVVNPTAAADARARGAETAGTPPDVEGTAAYFRGVLGPAFGPPLVAARPDDWFRVRWSRTWNERSGDVGVEGRFTPASLPMTTRPFTISLFCGWDRTVADRVTHDLGRGHPDVRRCEAEDRRTVVVDLSKPITVVAGEAIGHTGGLSRAKFGDAAFVGDSSAAYDPSVDGPLDSPAGADAGNVDDVGPDVVV